jgi:hypothetical protein
VDNPPNLDALVYRVRMHTGFKSEMIKALGQGPLRPLGTAGDDDPSLALLDAWATALDVLTFYQERIANEGYLRTATERRSVQELGRAVGYELNPGIAAETYLAFTLEEGKDAPEKVTIDSGTRVQSVPGPNEQPQTFETVEKIDARPEWNALKPQIDVRRLPQKGDTWIYLAGLKTGLQPGDGILVVGQERIGYPECEQWDFRHVKTVEPDAANNRTRVTWEDGLGHGHSSTENNPEVHAFRLCAALFGHNAPDPKLITLPKEVTEAAFFINTGNSRIWQGFIQGSEIDLDASYPKIVIGSWLVLKRPPVRADDRGYAELYRAKNVSYLSRSSFGLSGKTTRIVPDTIEHLSDFELDKTIVYAQSEQLEFAIAPYTARVPGAPGLEDGTLAPVEGIQIQLDSGVTHLPANRPVIVTGKRIRARVLIPGLILRDDKGTSSKPLCLDETLVVINPPIVDAEQRVTWHLRADDGFVGSLQTELGDLVLTATVESDLEISELVTVRASDGYPAKLHLYAPGLQNMYDRSTVRIAANVARATHGETRQEVLGSADAAQSFQRLSLRQSPLTFIPASTPGGGVNALQVRVNDVLWHEVPKLHGQGPRDRSFTARQGPDGNFIIQFGNGVNGARPPTGEENIHAAYRVGLGTAGNVKAGQLRVLLSRPLGVRGVINPRPATGGTDPEQAADARLNAACAALTLDRIVSLRDYEDFARGFGGIGKARADWLWDGSRGVVCVTVVDVHGKALDDGTRQRLETAMTTVHDPAQPFLLVTTDARRFCLRARMVIHPDYRAEPVLVKAKAAIGEAFKLVQREFGQDVTESEILYLLQSVEGVTAVDMERPYPGDEWDVKHRLIARLGRMTPDFRPAELLLLAERPDAILLHQANALSEPEWNGGPS